MATDDIKQPKPEKHVYDHKRRVHAAEIEAENLTPREVDLLNKLADIEDLVKGLDKT